MARVPDGLKYTKSHEWVDLNDDTATIGITDHAQSELGDIVFVELPSEGSTVSRGESFGSVESVKTVSDIYSPVTGEVIAVNAALGANSELINSAPYDVGYMIRVRVSQPVEGLLDAEAYRTLTE